MRRKTKREEEEEAAQGAEVTRDEK